MKSRLRMNLLFLCLLLTMLLASCSYTNRYWGKWGQWGQWKQGGPPESRNVIITSNPEGAKVYVNSFLIGNTPVTLSLPYPILRSERRLYQFQSFTPGVIEYLLLFSRPKTSLTATEREERSRQGSRLYTIEVRKDGYIAVKRSFSVPGTPALDFILRRKPTLFIKPFKVRNNFSLSVAQRLFNALYGKKFGVDISKFTDMDTRSLFPGFMKVFEITSDKHSQYVLEGEIIIEKEVTELGILLVAAPGKLVTAKKVFIETKHLDNLHQKMEPIIRSIIDAFVKEY